jgi:hypothetical protein
MAQQVTMVLACQGVIPTALNTPRSWTLDPELKRALLLRAAQEHISVSEVIRRAIGEYLRAS